MTDFSHSTASLFRARLQEATHELVATPINQAVSLQKEQLQEPEPTDETEQTKQQTIEQPLLMVSDCSSISDFYKPHLICDDSLAGRIRHFVDNWKEITSDPVILGIVKGAKIEFSKEYGVPVQNSKPVAKLHGSEAEFVNTEIDKLLVKGVIIHSESEPGEFLSTIFLTPKKDGSFRLILNLKELNEYVQYHHFKMDTVNTSFTLLFRNCYLASVDLRDAYYSVPVAKQHQKYLKFSWNGNLYQFTAMPNGLACAPRYFTKLMKPVFATLRQKGYISTS